MERGLGLFGGLVVMVFGLMVLQKAHVLLFFVGNAILQRCGWFRPKSICGKAFLVNGLEMNGERKSHV
jgi:hypothetical protein